MNAGPAKLIKLSVIYAGWGERWHLGTLGGSRVWFSKKNISLVIRTQISTENCRIRKTTLITILKNLFAVLAAAGAATAVAYYFFQSLASYSSPKLKWLKELASEEVAPVV